MKRQSTSNVILRHGVTSSRFPAGNDPRSLPALRPYLEIAGRMQEPDLCPGSSEDCRVKMFVLQRPGPALLDSLPELYGRYVRSRWLNNGKVLGLSLPLLL